MNKEDAKTKAQLIHDRDQLWASMRDIKDGIEDISTLLQKNVSLQNESKGLIPDIPCILNNTETKIVHSCVLAVLTELMLYKIDAGIHKWEIN